MADIDGIGVDLLIDRVVARHRAPDAAEDPVPGWLSPDEALLNELARLDGIDWPADEAGDRIAMRVAAATGQETGGSEPPGPAR
jgi:hypothetical protein